MDVRVTLEVLGDERKYLRGLVLSKVAQAEATRLLASQKGNVRNLPTYVLSKKSIFKRTPVAFLFQHISDNHRKPNMKLIILTLV